MLEPRNRPFLIEIEVLLQPIEPGLNMFRHKKKETMMNHNILVIDDDPEIHTVFKNILQPASDDIEIIGNKIFEIETAETKRASYRVDTVFQGKEGYKKVQNSIKAGLPYAVAFIDMRIPPGWDGATTAAKIREIAPDLQIVFITAFSDKSLDEIYAQIGCSSRIIFLNKPFSASEVRSITESLTQSYSVQESLEQVIENEKSCKKRFLANIQHELRTPLHHIIGFSDLGYRSSLEIAEQFPRSDAADLSEYFSLIKFSAWNLFGYISDISDLSLLESSQIEPKLVESNIIELLKMAVYQLPDGIKEKIHQLTFEKKEDVLALSCDPKLMINCFSKLITNATQYSSAHCEIEISITSVELIIRGQKQRQIKIVISDNGVGIPEDELELVFDSFTESSRTKDNSGGRGIGLSVCKRIVALHQGDIFIKNNPDAGVAVSVILPELPDFAAH